MDIITLGAAKKYTDDSLDGAGALKGAPCEIESIDDSVAGQHTITFKWEDKEETTHTDTMTVHDGAKGETGATGAAGQDGTDGADGITYVPEIGTVTTLQPNEPATASVTTDPQTGTATYNFGIPRGQDGSAAGADISDTATGTKINLTDSADARVQELTISGNSAGIGSGGLTVTTCNKNRLAFDSILASDTINGVTFEPQPDGGIYVHGTATATATYVFADDRKNAYATLNMPEYDGCILNVTGIPADKQSAVNVQVGERVSPWTMIARSSGSDVDIEYTAATESSGKYVFIFVDSGVSIDAVIYPMIRPSETSAAYVEHAHTALTLTTAMPLRAVGDVKDVADLASGTVTTRIDDDGQTVLATPVITSLSVSELAAWQALRTFDSVTRITATDNPNMTVGYLLNTDNGKALAMVQDDADKQLTGKVDKVQGKGLSTEDYTTAEKTKLGGVETGATANTVINTTVTLLAASWTGASAPYTQTVNVSGILATDKPILDVIISSTVATGVDEVDAWACITKADTAAGTITFSCYEDKPTIDLNVSVKVVRGAGGLTTTNIKSYTYTGTGSTSQSITFPDKPFMVLGASKEDVDDYSLSIAPFLWDANSTLLLYWQRKSGAAATGSMMSYSLTFSGNSVSWTGTDAGQALNVSGAAYTIYYI